MRRLTILCAGACLLLAGCNRALDSKVQQYRDSHVRELIADYETARLHGDRLGMCVKANLVSGAYADAHDPANSQAWQARRREDCRTALDAVRAQPRHDAATGAER